MNPPVTEDPRTGHDVCAVCGRPVSQQHTWLCPHSGRLLTRALGVALLLILIPLGVFARVWHQIHHRIR